ncbi:hypothetical protein ABMA28_010270 [Loxostege sticticalis]|uniref:Uncharacterized protein n=1 Tax=Loxostege sticticalis TaxID=481309 RepID=A0ABD0SAT4_LOXSC
MPKKEKKKPEDYLGKRQQALNTKVNQAVVDKVTFNDIKHANEASDLDKLFKIDVAAKYRNSDYIIDVLKCGDSLYISRALKKCLWLFDEDHTHIINPEFLHDNILPFMSTNMKKKLLTAVSIYVRTEERAVDFYHYCMKMKLYNIAFKFLLFTPKEFKLDIMRDEGANGPLKNFVEKNTDYIKHLIGKSFSLLEACFNLLSIHRRYELILQFKYFYTVSNDKYVECLEKYILPEHFYCQFSYKLSKDIMTKHKERVLKNPKFFEPLVDRDVFVKYTTADDAKVFAVSLLPEESSEFWDMTYYWKYEHFLKQIPHEETYAFIKKIFKDRYPKCEFEMTLEFHRQDLYRFMTQEEKEEWALRHLKSEKQLLGVGCDYLWYQYVGFEVSFETVKHMIMVTKEPEKRLDMCNVLVKSARNNRELEQLFIYYDKRHSNEGRLNHDNFLRTVITHQNVFIFDEACWEAFYVLLMNMELYNVLDFNDDNIIFKSVTLLYYILHGLAMNDGLKEYLLLHFETHYIYEHLDKLDKEKHEVIYTYLFKYYTDEILGFKDQIFTDEVRDRVKRYNRNIIGLMSKFREDTSVPQQKKEVYNQPKKERIVDNSLSDRELIRRLKTDTYLIKEVVPDLNERFLRKPFRVVNFLKKLKIYYSDDVAKTYLELFEDLVSKKCGLRSIEAGVFGILQLADEKRKEVFINEYAPQDSKINHKDIQPDQLRIQKAICRFLGYSRPPLPLASVNLYLRGDYVKFCLSIFDMYLAHLPIPMCVQFVDSIMDSPVSTQKHGIRLAFKCFHSNDLKKIVTDIWNKTKNVSLRGIIYKALYEKLKMDANEPELFDALKSFTLTLHQDDEHDIFGLFSHYPVLPDEYRGHHDEALWRAVGKFKDMQPNIDRKIGVINRMYIDMYIMNEEFVRTVVDEHVNTMLLEKKLHLNYSNEGDLSRLLDEKWKLTARYIIHYATFATTNIDKYVKLTEEIVEKCIELWSEEYRGMNHFQELCSQFFIYLKEESYVIHPTVQNYETVIPVYESMLNKLMKNLPLRDIYMLVWDLRLTIITRREIQTEKDNALTASDVWIDIIPKSSTRLGRDVGKLIIEYVENKTYFSSFIPDICQAIRSAAKDHLFCLNGFKPYDVEKVFLYVASGLLEHEFPETHIMAINMLPDTGHILWSSDEVGQIVQKVKSYPDSEVQAALYFKQYSKKIPYPRYYGNHYALYA